MTPDWFNRYRILGSIGLIVILAGSATIDEVSERQDSFRIAIGVVLIALGFLTVFSSVMLWYRDRAEN